MLNHKTYFILLVVSFSFFIGVWARAQEAGIIITPHIIDEKAKARDILKYTVKVKNNTDRKVNIYASVNDISMTEGRQEFVDPNLLDKTESLARWIEFKRGVIELFPGEEMDVPLEINVSMYALPGKRYAAISFPTGGNRTIAEANMLENNYPQLLINVEVTEEIIEKAQLNNFHTGKNTYLGFPVTFSFDIQNSGNRETVPTGAIYIYNRRGQEIDKLDLNPLSEKVGAAETKSFSVNWTADKGFGKFKARMEGEYGETERHELADTVYFWMLPLQILLIYGGGLILLTVLVSIIIFRRTYRQHPAARHANLPMVQQAANGVLDLRGQGRNR